jgi:hypothetical protein
VGGSLQKRRRAVVEQNRVRRHERKAHREAVRGFAEARSSVPCIAPIALRRGTAPPPSNRWNGASWMAAPVGADKPRRAGGLDLLGVADRSAVLCTGLRTRELAGAAMDCRWQELHTLARHA